MGCAAIHIAVCNAMDHVLVIKEHPVNRSQSQESLDLGGSQHVGPFRGQALFRPDVDNVVVAKRNFLAPAYSLDDNPAEVAFSDAGIWSKHTKRIRSFQIRQIGSSADSVGLLQQASSLFSYVHILREREGRGQESDED